jgi:AraC-like DNA-binding protein
MPTNAEIADGLGRRFHGPSAHTIIARVRPTLQGITISRVVSDTPNPDVTLPPKLEAGYSIHLHHKTLLDGETWIDGKHAEMPPIMVGSICIFDLETSPVARVHDPLDFTRFGISQATVMDLAYERGQSTSGRLRIPGLGHPDPVIQSLALALVNRAKMFGQETDSLFADWIGLAFHPHLIDTYGETPATGPVRWSIAPWRLRRACEMMMEKLSAPLSIAEIAAAVDMTPEYFARAFRQAVGEPPHRWLMRKRIDRAKQLMKVSRSSLAEVAWACGFVDQSHLTKVFSRMEGVTPGVWRRRQLG